MLFSANLLSWLHWSITHFYRKKRISHSSLCRQRFLGNVLKSVPLIQSFYFQKPNTCFSFKKNILWVISSNLCFNIRVLEPSCLHLYLIIEFKLNSTNEALDLLVGQILRIINWNRCFFWVTKIQNLQIFLYLIMTKELSLCHKLKFSNPYIFATWLCELLIFQT